GASAAGEPADVSVRTAQLLDRRTPRAIGGFEASRHGGVVPQASLAEAALTDEQRALPDNPVVVLNDGTGTGDAVADAVRAAGGRPLLVGRGDHFERSGDDSYLIDPSDPEGFEQLAAHVCAGDPKLAGVIDCWGATPPGDTELDDAALVALLAPMRFAHSLSNRSTVRPLPMLLVARGTARIEAGEVLDPPRALGAGVAKVLPQEHPGLR